MRSFQLINKYRPAAAATVSPTAGAQKKQVKYNYSDKILKCVGSFTHARGAKNLEKMYQ